MVVRTSRSRDIVYPESDGQPLGENTLQVNWIVELYNGLQALFRNRDDVFVAADLFWYPVRGEPGIVLAPDVMVAIGRPKGDRPSYKQWEENGVAPQVVFEIISPGNSKRDRAGKLDFYREHGVEEYYEYDPDRFILLAWRREGTSLAPVESVNGLTSQRLGVTFVVPGDAPMTILGPDGTPFKSYLHLLAEHEERVRLAEAEKQRSEKLAAKLRELGIDPESI